MPRTTCHRRTRPAEAKIKWGFLLVVISLLVEERLVPCCPVFRWRGREGQLKKLNDDELQI